MAKNLMDILILNLQTSKEFETKIPAMGENLEIKKNIAEDKVNIIKESIAETKTVEIDLTREVVTIERRSIDNNSFSYEFSNSIFIISIEGPVDFRTEISIPLKRSQY